MFDFENPQEIDNLLDHQHNRKKLKDTIFRFTPEYKLKLLLIYYEYGMDFKRLINLFSCKNEHINEILIDLNIKRCTKCQLIKSRNEFDPHQGFDGLYSQCKQCEREYHTTEIAIYQRKIRNQSERRKYLNRTYQSQRKKDNNIFRLSSNLSSLISRSLKKYTLNVKKNNIHWETLVGYTLQDLVIHLESQFYKDPNINWDNYGSYWHVDHIIPRSLFNIQELGDEEFKKCWNLNNLQPLYWIDNIQKGNKYLVEDIV